MAVSTHSGVFHFPNFLAEARVKPRMNHDQKGFKKKNPLLVEVQMRFWGVVSDVFLEVLWQGRAFNDVLVTDHGEI